MSPNRLKHRKAFKRIGQYISAQIRDYETGKEIQGEWRAMPSVLADRDATKYGPVLRTMQLDRGVKR